MGDFSFKQFHICQDRTAMKVGTDGVLLGAWAEGGTRVLDIGTGTGVIALMMAQRFPESSVVGIDVDADASSQALENVQASPFADRVEVVCSSLQDFAAKGETSFPSIVSNPPYFEHSLRNPDQARATARHADTLPFADLFSGVGSLLADDGVFSAIVPSESVGSFCSYAHLSGLFVSRQCFVKTTPRKPARRCLLAFRKHQPATFEREEVCLQNADGTRSDWYAALTADFYL